MTSDPHKKNPSSLTRRNTLIGLTSISLITGFSFYGSRILRSHQQQKISYPQYTLRTAYLNNQISPLISLAQEKGILNHYGIQLIPIPNIQDKTEIFTCLKENKCDLAVLSILDWLPEFLSAHSIPAKLITGTTGEDFRLLVSYKQKIDRLMDLTGSKIAIPKNTQKAKLFFSILLRRKGINPDMNIQWIEMEREELLPSLLSNQVQAIIGSDPFIWQILHDNNKRIFELAGSNSSSWSSRINQVIGISDLFLQNNPDILKPLITALQKTALWQNSHLQEASQTLADQEGSNNSASDIFKMLQNENKNPPLTTTPLWEQVAQYIDELKLLNQLPNSFKSGRAAKQFCVVSP